MNMVERVVKASVSGHLISLPEHAVSAGSSHLRLITEEWISTQNYADSVAIVLLALARCGQLASVCKRLAAHCGTLDNTGSNMAAPSQDGISANSSVHPPQI